MQRDRLRQAAGKGRRPRTAGSAGVGKEELTFSAWEKASRLRDHVGKTRQCPGPLLPRSQPHRRIGNTYWFWTRRPPAPSLL